MDQAAFIAYLNSQTVCAQITAMGMVAQNTTNLETHGVIKYDYEDFQQVITDHNIGHNDIIQQLLNNPNIS